LDGGRSTMRWAALHSLALDEMGWCQNRSRTTLRRVESWFGIRSVGVTEQVANDSSGKHKFLWAFVYEANLNGQLVTRSLAVCSVDVIVH